MRYPSIQKKRREFKSDFEVSPKFKDYVEREDPTEEIERE